LQVLAWASASLQDRIYSFLYSRRSTSI
jgi:hypothetical protein